MAINFLYFGLIYYFRTIWIQNDILNTHFQIMLVVFESRITIAFNNDRVAQLEITN